ncbi:geranylgeranylglyceryl phosphate synthase [Salinimicrobium marinum]|uniref:Geranylgeranylglyceryl phosphate synthase n=1 Tax=Salinimicrobium marinum TaxID=680283 RepID=A0A918SIR5_9FLAO|nr:geranylgeranylglyceryl/heptaprenylglyceryl phosphate synthase [Salinimicrobium marinum]GHA44950.1 geranylgeranylglyceryl phosphate synthase [Salinimicrobium marinum]
MASFLNLILNAVTSEEKLLSVLIDPDKFDEAEVATFLQKLPKQTSFLLVGGSTVEAERTKTCVEVIKRNTDVPVILFPGDFTQIADAADGILFLSLISGRNPEYLIGQQVKAAPILQKSSLEILPVGYILIDGGKESAVERVSETEPLSQEKVQVIVETALAGEYSGKRMIYLEAGSGAIFPVSNKIISEVKRAVSIPLIVGGGIRSQEQLQEIYSAGADVVVVGTAFEEGSWEELPLLKISKEA